MKLEYIKSIKANDDYSLQVIFEDGLEGSVDIKPYLADEAFGCLNDIHEFKKIHNGGYFVEWLCGADLSADTLRYKIEKNKVQTVK